MRSQENGWLQVIQHSVREVPPSAFAFVMATGIISTALYTNGMAVASDVFLLVAAVGYVGLVVALTAKLIISPGSLRQYLVSPNGFAFLSFVAGTNVLATRVTVAGHTTIGTVLLAIGAFSWLVLGYAVPLALMTGRHHDRGLRFITGMWFLWVVSVQSVAVAASTLAPRVDFGGLPVLATACWAIGLVLYPFMATLWLARLLLLSVTPAQLRPEYWIFMGACAITVLAGASVANMPTHTVLPQSVVVGMSFVQWAFCTWLLPLLVGLGVWRHVVRRYPLRYEAGMWGMVFPIGMYGVASNALGKATDADWLSSLAGGEGWFAAAVWLAVFVGMLATARNALQRR